MGAAIPYLGGSCLSLTTLSVSRLRLHCKTWNCVCSIHILSRGLLRKLRLPADQPVSCLARVPSVYVASFRDSGIEICLPMSTTAQKRNAQLTKPHVQTHSYKTKATQQLQHTSPLNSNTPTQQKQPKAEQNRTAKAKHENIPRKPASHRMGTYIQKRQRRTGTYVGAGVVMDTHAVR
jgi:hypothetical protein